MKELTKKQAAVLECVKAFIQQKGYSPTTRELAEALGYQSSSTVHSLLDKLAAKGYISKEASGPRTIRVLHINRAGVEQIVEHCGDLNHYDTEEHNPPECVNNLNEEQQAEIEEWVGVMLRHCAQMAVDMYLDE
ncbi:MarR family transcriptional regulator [Paenibacillus sp. PL2-23]|uniref:LexA family protein n=1 Tax=Paenibacillus sp. PL2-23 TaxID=2100729 RepID=UPI0030F7E627